MRSLKAEENFILSATKTITTKDGLIEGAEEPLRREKLNAENIVISKLLSEVLKRVRHPNLS